jgi:DNA polymerase elongation subunit (family B)/ribonuclease HI
MKQKMSSTQSFFVYSWHIDEKEREVTSIRAYGLNKNNENICIRIDDFTPYVYVQLPEGIPWDEGKAQIVANKIDELLGHNKPLKKSLVFKKKLYYAYISPEGKRKIFPFLFLSFSSQNDIRLLSAKLTRNISVPLLGSLKLKVHENNAPVVLQLSCVRDIPVSGWIQFRGEIIPEEEKVTFCNYEYKVRYKNLLPMKENISVVHPLIMGYDIEVYSSNPNKMPSADHPKDVIFQASVVLSRNNEKEDKYEKYLLSLFDPDNKSVGEDVHVLKYKTETELLLGFVTLIKEKQPNIICGYNIFTFDIPYMIQRAKHNFILSEFDKQGFDKFGHAKEKTISWSSSAYKNQSFQYLEAEGRLFVDLLPIVMRDYKLSDYTLKTVSNNFLGETKDPLTHKGIFKCYDLGKKGGDRGAKAMGIVGKYCVQDSALVVKLFDKLQIWFGLTEMANICNVPVFDLFTRGQQLKVFSQVFKECMAENMVVERDGYIPKEDEHYQGAHVFDPVPGVYDCVVPFDFASLYPSIIIAYNIDYSTLVPDDSPIPDSDCHIFEWDEHIGCEHETKKRNSKPKHILCGHRRFRFLKTFKGILPTLLENLLSARKKTRSLMKDIKKSVSESVYQLTGEVVDVETANFVEMVTHIISKCQENTNEIKENLTLLEVLDKRQLSLKVSANSGYGAMGVSKGFLPLMPGAMCVTAKGRQSIDLVAKLIPEKYGGKLIYGDTDSNYVVFPHLKTPAEIWEHSEKVSKEVSAHFPKPMKLEFEGVIYWRFLILTMKRYMSLKCDKDGNVGKKIEKKGVLLSRRDNSNFVRTVYSDIILKIFDKKDTEHILFDVISYVNKLCAYHFSCKDFIITKSVGSLGDGKFIPEVIPLKKNKGLLGNYTVPILSKEKEERKRQLKLKNVEDDNRKECEKEKEYYVKCLPAQVQLAEKIRRRGGRVDVGVRLEFVVLKTDDIKAKQYEKIESADYYKEHTSTLKIDTMYYLKALANPLDQVLECTVFEQKRKNRFSEFESVQCKDFVYKLYLNQLLKAKVLDELLNVFRPKLQLLDEFGNQIQIERKLKKKSKEFFLFIDGVSKGNPGPSGAGAVLYDQDKNEIASEYKYLKCRTNNEAEYESLLLGIELCQNFGIDTNLVNVKCNSKLIVHQINIECLILDEKLQKLNDRARKTPFKSIKHVSKNLNKRAHEFANLGLSLHEESQVFLFEE